MLLLYWSLGSLCDVSPLCEVSKDQDVACFGFAAIQANVRSKLRWTSLADQNDQTPVSVSQMESRR